MERLLALINFITNIFVGLSALYYLFEKDMVGFLLVLENAAN